MLGWTRGLRHRRSAIGKRDRNARGQGGEMPAESASTSGRMENRVSLDGDGDGDGSA